MFFIIKNRNDDEMNTLEDDDDYLNDEKLIKKINYLSEWEPIRTTINDKENENCIENLKSNIIEVCVEPGWRINDIILASKVLEKTKNSEQLVYSDEAEMRRVFHLVYDVLRCKKY